MFYVAGSSVDLPQNAARTIMATDSLLLDGVSIAYLIAPW